MDLKKKKRIDALIAELETLVPAEDAKVRIDVYGGGIDESYLRGNESGLLRMGMEIIKSGTAPHKESSSKFAPDAVEADIERFFHGESDISIDWIERTDDLDSETHLTTEVRRQRRSGWLWTVLAILVVLLVLFVWHTVAKGAP